MRLRPATTFDKWVIWISAMVICLAISACGLLPEAPPPPNAICDSLRPVVPSSSTQDTEQSREENANFVTVFDAVCS